MIIDNRYEIKRWEDSNRTYDCINIQTQDIEYSGSLRECLDYCKGIDTHKAWNDQDWSSLHMFHLPELTEKDEYYRYELDSKTNWLI